jgi:hypothetical protein
MKQTLTLLAGVENGFTELSSQPGSPGRPVRMKKPYREIYYE